MASITETGHKINVANLETLISVFTGFGSKYNPVKKSLQLPDLNTLLTNAQKELANVNLFISLRDKAITARHYAFEPMTGIVTKVVYALKSSDVPKMTVGEIEAVARKLKGTRKTAKIAATPDKPLTPEEEARKYISVSQLRFDSRIENLDKLIQLLKAQIAYAPNESELSVAGLTALLDTMKSTNSEAINAKTALSNAYLQRNKVLYEDTTGLVAIGSKAKTYIKSVFGPSSPEFKQISKLRFIKRN